MAWIEKRKASDGTAQFRLRDRVGDKCITVVKNLGSWKGAAEIAKINYERALAQGLTFKLPTTPAEIERCLKAKAEGRESEAQSTRLSIEEMCDHYIRLHGPSLKGGVDLKAKTPYYNFVNRTQLIKRLWAGKYADEINKLDVRDLLAHYTNVGSRMKLLGAVGHIFRSFYDWNEEGNIFDFKVRLPSANPVAKWRKEMKAVEKRELPDTRVLTPDEWSHFRSHLKARTLAICQIALQRFLRLSDIRHFTQRQITNGYINGIQQKTGEAFCVPVLADQPTKYDFRNFKREFLKAQRDAGMDWPASDPRHFSVKDLRRTGATWAYRKTKDLVGISDALGHRSTKTTRLYLNINDVDRMSIAAAVDEIADGAKSAEHGVAGFAPPVLPTKFSKNRI